MEALNDTGILLTAYGTVSTQGIASIGLFMNDIEQSFPKIPIRFAFTSDRIRNSLKKMGNPVDSIAQALLAFKECGITRIAVQPLNLINGVELKALHEELACYAKKYQQHIQNGEPLLSSQTDLQRTVDAMKSNIPAERIPEEPVVWVGHGTYEANCPYTALAEIVSQQDPNAYIGTLETGNDYNTLLPVLKQKQVKHVWLLPFFALLGNHALTDLAGNDPESWRGQLESHGFYCRQILKGIIEYPEFRAIWLDHLQKALTELSNQ